MLSQSAAPLDAQLQGALCALHPTAPATTVCPRCGSYACSACTRVGTDNLSYCSSCVSKVEVLAGRGARFLANLLDQLALSVPTFGGFLLMLTAGKALGSERGAQVVAMLSVLCTLGLIVYQFSLVVAHGQTLGKRILHIRVVRTDGTPASFARIFFLRNLLPLGASAIIGIPLGASAVIGIFSLVDALFIFGPGRRCLHDLIADTKVVKRPAWEPGGR